jgi:alkaline phosphatase D
MTEENSSGGLDRRSFLVLGAAATGAAVIPAGVAAADDARKKKPAKPADPFGMGVASGDPTSTSVILWTRLAPKPLELDGGMGKKGTQQVSYEIATDAKFTKNVQKGTVEAPAEYGHSVHLDVQGLTPDTEYYYRFKSGKFITETARTRTAPDPSQSVDAFVFGQTSCANWQSGYYQLYDDLAAQEPHYWLALGDYIYEYANYNPKTEEGYVRPDGKVLRPIPWGLEPVTLAEYRRQYGLYRSDPSLQKLHRTAPYSVIWDDHEVDNNFTAGKSGGDGQADRIEFEKRRAAGFQAFYENHAIRIPAPGQMPSKMDIYRRVDWGSLASFLLLDGRQYRTDQPGDNTPNDFGPWVEGMFDPNATILGSEQEAWLAAEFKDAPGMWTFIAQQTVMSSLNGAAALPDPSFLSAVAKGLFNYDAWDGYWAARGRMVDAIKAGQTRNVVVLTGDFHTNLTFDLLEAWPDPRDAKTPAEMSEAVKNWQGKALGTEICAGAISSPTFFGDPLLGLIAPGVLERTPWIQFAEFYNNGYVLNTVTPEELTAEYRVAKTNFKVSTKEGKPRTEKTLTIKDGIPGVSSPRKPS